MKGWGWQKARLPSFSLNKYNKKALYIYGIVLFLYLERSFDSAVIFLVNEIFAFLTGQSFHQFLDFRTFLISFTDSDNIRIRGIGAFDKESIFRMQVCFEGKVDIDDRNIRIF